MIKEINPACYIFKVDFLKKYLKKVKKSPVTGEYYLVSLIGIAIKNNEKIETHRILDLPWRGVNTKIELQEAEKLFAQIKK
jgi:bifunctional N-acetylglucosamine-1-phosphate-uridyltransferase/glucosamine-1-phosphate-acetyltransferase GlmU-like protein